MERRITAILAADVIGYSRLMGADEAGTLAALRWMRAKRIWRGRSIFIVDILTTMGLWPSWKLLAEPYQIMPAFSS